MFKATFIKKYRYLYSVLIVFLFTGETCRKFDQCENGGHEYFYIKNNSSIKVNWMSDDNPNDSIWTVNGQFLEKTDRLISANSQYSVGAGLEQCFEYEFQNGNHRYYFIFDHDTVQTIGWEGITGTNRGLLKRIKVDLNYLQNNNFIITYP